MDPREQSKPDFANWPSSQLQMMLLEYEGSLPAIRALYGGSAVGQEEEGLYKSWIAAIERELAKRGRDRVG